MFSKILNPVSPIDFIYEGYYASRGHVLTALKPHLEEGRINSLFESSSPLDKKTCKVLSDVFGRTPESWMNLSNMYYGTMSNIKTYVKFKKYIGCGYTKDKIYEILDIDEDKFRIQCDNGDYRFVCLKSKYFEYKILSYQVLYGDVGLFELLGADEDDTYIVHNVKSKAIYSTKTKPHKEGQNILAERILLTIKIGDKFTTSDPSVVYKCIFIDKDSNIVSHTSDNELVIHSPSEKLFLVNS